MNRVHESQRPLLRAGPINVLQEGACAEPEDFVKSAAERARCWAGEAHRGRGSAWPLSMHRERRPRSNVEVEAGAGPVWRGRRGGECGRQRSATVITLQVCSGFQYLPHMKPFVLKIF